MRLKPNSYTLMIITIFNFNSSPAIFTILYVFYAYFDFIALHKTEVPSPVSLDEIAPHAWGIAAVIKALLHLVIFNRRRRQVKPTYCLKALGVTGP